MKRYAEEYPALLKGFVLETLESDPNTICGLAPDMTLNYLNPAWFTFAAENGGEPIISEKYMLGAHIGDAMSGTARDYYLDNFEQVLKTGKVWRHEYECSSPDTFRKYHQTVYPLFDRNGLIIVHSLTNEYPHATTPQRAHLPIKKLYTQQSGLITQCSNCRRVQLVSQPEVWDWVPAWVVNMPENTSHTICPICYGYYYACK